MFLGSKDPDENTEEGGGGGFFCDVPIPHLPSPEVPLQPLS